MLDYIIIGCGLAGIAFAEQLEKNKCSFVVIADNSQNSSVIAAGLYNPVVLKRFTAVWNAQLQLDLVSQYYRLIEEKLKIKLDYKNRLFRKFTSIEEQNDWFLAADKTSLSDFLSIELIHFVNHHIPNEFKFGEVLQSGYLDTELLVKSYKQYLQNKNKLIAEAFDYDQLSFEDNIKYKQFNAKHIVFAEGFGIQYNPYFKNIPLDGTKGELLIIKATDLKCQEIVKSAVFLIPLGNDLYKVGATYNREDKTNIPTKEAKAELISELNKLITSPYEIVKHNAGIRPTVRDRRPLLGTHPKYKNVHILNGLGTRGVMLAPAMAINLYNYIENKIPLDPTINLIRFKKWYATI
jgi:glycine/D-amino acid oxidase-like deaminating enzyme